jgi:hypothetical protein
MALHMLYGIGAGAAYAVGVTALGLGVGSGALTTSLLWAVIFGLALTVVGALYRDCSVRPLYRVTFG